MMLERNTISWKYTVEIVTDRCESEANNITYGKLWDSSLTRIDGSWGDLLVPSGSNQQTPRSIISPSAVHPEFPFFCLQHTFVYP